jgi:hypothetical protein
MCPTSVFNIVSGNNKFCSDSGVEWSSPGYASKYLEVAENIPHKNEGEQVLLDNIPKDAERILNLGTGDGRLIKLIRQQLPHKIQQQLSMSLSLSLSLL